MIKLKSEVNKSAVMRELQEEANKYYAESWQPQLQVRAYMNGVHDLFKKLRIADVSSNEGQPISKIKEMPEVAVCDHELEIIQLGMSPNVYRCKKCWKDKSEW